MMNKLLVTAAALALTAVSASAETIRWARAGDSITLDPHSQNEGPTHALAHQMYDPLLQRDMSGTIIPVLATEWAALPDNPNIWRFKLRQGVTYHDGAAFDSEDVVFSLNRAMADGSEMKELLSSVKEVRAVDAHTLDIETHGANPLLINNLTNMFIMDKGWAEANDVMTPHDVAKGETNFATMNTNGTGAFMLVSRSVDEKTVLTANPNYWGKDIYPNQVSELIYTPIQSAATRVAALLSGEVDIIQDVPVQDLGRVSATDGLSVGTAAQNRVIFFGLDTKEGPTSNLKVRQAMNIAINRDAIKQVVMRGQSDPTGVIMPPFVNGWTEALNAYPAYDIEAAKALMAEAGLADGFDITLNCPNDRYINDAKICEAIGQMLSAQGIPTKVVTMPKNVFFKRASKGAKGGLPEFSFVLVGWGSGTGEPSSPLKSLLATHDKSKGMGASNRGRHSDPRVNKVLNEALATVDDSKRGALLAKATEIAIGENTGIIPLHYQVNTWATRKGLKFDPRADERTTGYDYTPVK